MYQVILDSILQISRVKPVSLPCSWCDPVVSMPYLGIKDLHFHICFWPSPSPADSWKTIHTNLHWHLHPSLFAAALYVICCSLLSQSLDIIILLRSLPLAVTPTS
eukprot:TRINITY_DN26200_c0_g1_i1.p1 TRINITY_DN26200_c0_g1~~TRINITY_DN26200_c0_g1_i1.p1  ORF type:complete len:105 (-),score=4.34 TRINITY_DN26200_c0_g1_i1:293-607(-)